MLEQYVKKILTSRVYDVAVETPLQPARQLSERLGNQVLLKREDLQPVFSFKIRGAYNKVAQLTEEDKARGVIAASAGNHAQGLALAAKRQGIRAVIVMPKTTPEIKVQAVRAHGAKAVLHGDAFPEALAHALKLVDEKGYTFVHPYDDPDTIAGQGTVAMEILRQQPGRLDAIFVPVGGGGLVAGIAAYVKYLRPEIKVIGVEPDESNCLQAAMAAGERVVLGQVGLFADGVAVAQIGQHTFDICKDHVDEVITVSTDEICAAIKDIDLTDNELAKLHIRHMVGGHAVKVSDEMVFRFEFPERPGALFNFLTKLGGRWNISMFHYRNHGAADGRVVAGLQVPEDERHLIPQTLEAIGYPYWDETANPAYQLFLG